MNIQLNRTTSEPSWALNIIIYLFFLFRLLKLFKINHTREQHFVLVRAKSLEVSVSYNSIITQGNKGS